MESDTTPEQANVDRHLGEPHRTVIVTTSPFSRTSRHFGRCGLPAWITCVLAVALARGTTSAALITVPPGLDPGEQYRLAFVTSTAGYATSADITHYNAFVSTAANSVPELAALATTWSAIASTDSYSAMANTATHPLNDASHPIYRLDGTAVVHSYASLWDGDLDAPISVTETGILKPTSVAEPGTFHLDETVYTGSDNNGYGTYWSLGSAGDPLNGIPSYFVNVGVMATDHRWIYGGPIDGSANQAHFYAISGVLTVVPEPANFSLMAIGCLGLLSRKRGAPVPEPILSFC